MYAEPRTGLANKILFKLPTNVWPKKKKRVKLALSRNGEVQCYACNILNFHIAIIP